MNASETQAQSEPLYVSLGPANAALYTPDSGGAHVAVLAIHRTANLENYFVCPELARRGFACLGISTRFDNNKSQVIFEQLALDVKAGINFLRSLPGITTVLLWGHSGGGPSADKDFIVIAGAATWNRPVQYLRGCALQQFTKELFRLCDRLDQR